MSLSEDVDLEEFVMAKDDLSGADIKAVCTEAGLLALRERRMRVTKADFTTARERVRNFFSFSYSFSALTFFVACGVLYSNFTFCLVRYCTGKTRVHRKGFTSRLYFYDRYNLICFVFFEPDEGS